MTVVHGAVAAALSHKHYPIIHVGAGPIQLIYGSPLQLAGDANHEKILFSNNFWREFPTCQSRLIQKAWVWEDRGELHVWWARGKSGGQIMLGWRGQARWHWRGARFKGDGAERGGGGGLWETSSCASKHIRIRMGNNTGTLSQSRAFWIDHQDKFISHIPVHINAVYEMNLQYACKCVCVCVCVCGWAYICSAL